jgi:hypothetical protein
MLTREFVWSSEGELVVWCARTTVPGDLRARIRQRVQGRVNWTRVLELAGHHGVIPLLYRTLSSVCAELVPDSVLVRLRQKAQACALLNRAQAKELGRLAEAFAEQGVPVLGIKGATLAAAAYGDVTLRDFSDLDLLIPERALGAAQDVLLAAGYERRDPSSDPEAGDHEEGPYHVFVKPRTVFRVDLQWVMAHQHFSFLMDRPEFWDNRTSVILEGKPVQGLAPEELLILLCVHGSKHAWEQLKWVCDVAEVLRANPGLDWNRIFACASAWGCRRLVHIGLTMAQLVLDAPVAEAAQVRYLNDADVRQLSHRMPATLLANPRAGITEEQAEALYFALKDTAWERWRFGLMLCRDQSSIVDRPPTWLSGGSVLAVLSYLLRPLQRAIRNLVPEGTRGTLNRWVEHGS